MFHWLQNNSMTFRLISASCFALLSTLAVVWVMQGLIVTGNAALVDAVDFRMVDFIQITKAQTLNKTDKKPTKPKPQKAPPLTRQPQQDDVEPMTFQTESLDVSMSKNQEIGAGLMLDKGEGDYLPIVKVAPQYPRRAQNRGIEGWVLLEFTVTENGSVSDVQVIQFEPSAVFNSAAINAAKKFKYKPRIVNGKPIPVAGVQHLISFRLEK